MTTSIRHIAGVLGLTIIAATSYAQAPYAATDKKALAIPASQTATTADIAGYVKANFTSDSDKARAIFVWIADNIEYDVANMYALNFYETREDKVLKALKNRKGVCENIAALFADIATQSGLRSYMVYGYTKQNGMADYIPHAWTAVQISREWFLFDATWGSGHLENGRFVKQMSEAYFKVPPRRLIRSHMPFDPMWEFLSYPVTNQEFYEGKTEENKNKPYFSFTDSIAVYDRQDSLERWADAARRIEGNGIRNSMIFDRLQHIKSSIEVYRNKHTMDEHNGKVEQYNKAVTDFNEGVNYYNDYINYWNKQFKPSKPDDEIQAMFDAAYNRVTRARTTLANIKEVDEQLKPMVTTVQKSISDIMVRLEESKTWLQKYFSKGKLLRPTMFMKVGR